MLCDSTPSRGRLQLQKTCASVDESYYFLFSARSLKFPHARARFEGLSNGFFMVNAFAFAETRSLRNAVENPPPPPLQGVEFNEHPCRTVIHNTPFELRVNTLILYSLFRGDGDLLRLTAREAAVVFQIRKGYARSDEPNDFSCIQLLDLQLVMTIA